MSNNQDKIDGLNANISEYLRKQAATDKYSERAIYQKGINACKELIKELQLELSTIEVEQQFFPIQKTNTMNFFQKLEQQFPDADLNIRVKTKSGSTTVSVLPVSKTENDIEPIIITGTPEELDAEFFNLIAKPIETTKAAIVNLEEQQKSVKEATETKPAPKPAATKGKDSKPAAKKDAKKTISKKETVAPVEGDLFGDTSEPVNEDVNTDPDQEDTDPVESHPEQTEE